MRILNVLQIILKLVLIDGQSKNNSTNEECVSGHHLVEYLVEIMKICDMVKPMV